MFRREHGSGAGQAEPAAAPASASSRGAHHVDALTGVRGFAAFWVFFFHAWLGAGRPTVDFRAFGAGFDATPLFAFGWLGVDVFFVLSGFLLTLQAWGKLDRPPPPGRFAAHFGERYTSFLKRRILRVYPAYYACMSVLLPLAAAGIYRSLPGRADLLLHLAMFHNVVERYIESINDVFWTLPFEWQFYLVFPLLFIALRRTAHRPLRMFLFYAAAALLAMAIKQYVIHIRDGYLQVHLPIRLDAFVAGMCAATYAQHRRWPRRVAAAAFVAGLAGLFATPWIYAAYPFGGHYFDLMGMSRPVWVQASLCLFLLGLVGEPHFGVRVFAHRVTVWLGLVSYSIYLVHVPILGLLPKLGAYPALGLAPDNSLARILLFAVPAVVACSALLYYSIEKPFQDSGRVAAVATAGAPARARRLRRPFTVLFLWAVALFAFLLVARQ